MLIKASHLALALDGNVILEDVSLRMDTGDIYGLLGPNGAGKSTTIALLLGLYQPDRGRLERFSREDTDLISIRRRIGVMPEFAGFYEWMSAREYLNWYAGFYGGLQAQPQTLLERVGLAETGSKPIARFSRGMKQRLALARALAHGPELLILDEPTNGLDPRGRREIHDLLIELAAGGKVGILLCTHLLDDVERLCTRIGIIDAGRTVLEDDLDHLLGDAAGTRFRLHMTEIPEHHPLPRQVRLFESNGAWWTLEMDLPPGMSLRDVWRDLLTLGWSFDELRVEKNSLESHYLAITGGDQHFREEQAA